MESISKFSTFLTLLHITLILQGCKDYFKPSISTICESHPHLCEGLNQDGWCRQEKADIIRHSYEHMHLKTDAHLYPLLKYYEDYEVCIEKASQIRHIKYREKESDRMNGYLTAQSRIKEISRATKDSADPNLQYFHWSRYGDDKAKKRFLAQASAFDTPELFIKLASVYLKNDNEAARKALYRALRYYDDIDDVDSAIYRSLITVNLDDERYSSAFVWANVYSEVDDAGEQALTHTKSLLLKPINSEELTQLASKIESAINDGEFNADRVGLWRLN